MIQHSLPPRKLDSLLALMESGKWEEAIKFAARFPRLGKQREPILTAASALLSPRFYENLNRNPQNLVEAGIAALKERYPSYLGKGLLLPSTQFTPNPES